MGVFSSATANDGGATFCLQSLPLAAVCSPRTKIFPTNPPRTIGRKIESSDRAADHTGGPPMSGGHNATFVSLHLGFGAAKGTF